MGVPPVHFRSMGETPMPRKYEAKSPRDVLVCVALFGGCKSTTSNNSPVSPTSNPASQPVAEVTNDSGESVTVPKKKYNDVKYRIVNNADECVAVLENGATVITRHVDSPVVAVRGYSYTGGVYEGKWLGGGLSHLLEHLVAGGADGRRTEEQNRDLLQKIGNDSDAETSDDHTAFYINTTKPHLDDAIDIVTGWLLSAKIDPDEYRREYQVVQRELEMDKGIPDRVFAEIEQMNRYHVSPARVPTIGFQAVIQGLSRDDVYTYYKLAYVPNNLVFCVAGDFTPDEMLAAVQKYVGDVPPGREFSRNIPDEPPVLAPRTVVATFPKLGEARLEIAFPSVRLQHQDLYVLDLLAAVAGLGDSSMLVEDLRDKQQLVSDIDCSDYTPTYVAGTFAVDMQLDAEKIPAATMAVLDDLEKLKTEPIDPARIKAAKTLIRTTHIKSVQKSEEIADDIATSYMFTDDIHFNDRYVERIDQITAEQLQAAAMKYLDRNKLLTTALLPSEFVGAQGMPKAEDLLREASPTTEKSTTQPTDNQITRVELENGTILIHQPHPHHAPGDDEPLQPRRDERGRCQHQWPG